MQPEAGLRVIHLQGVGLQDVWLWVVDSVAVDVSVIHLQTRRDRLLVRRSMCRRAGLEVGSEQPDRSGAGLGSPCEKNLIASRRIADMPGTLRNCCSKWS